MTKQEIQNRIEEINTLLKNNFEPILTERVKAELESIDMEACYDEMLDECNGTIKIGSLEYCASRVLAEVDPIAYRCGFSDFTDSEESDKRVQEIGGEYYDYDEVQEIRDSIESELGEEQEELYEELENIEE